MSDRQAQIFSLIYAAVLVAITLMIMPGCTGEAIATVPQKIVVCDGNSITHGLGPNSTWPDELRRETGWDVLNVGTPLYTTAELSENAQVRVDALRPGVVIIWEGVNSYLTDHLTAAAAYTQLSGYIAARKAYETHPKVVTITLMPSPELGDFVDAYNALVAANTAGADLVIDLRADPRLSDPLNETYFFTDHLHPIDAGYRAIGEDVAKALH